jgi:hypothetical protein
MRTLVLNHEILKELKITKRCSLYFPPKSSSEANEQQQQYKPSGTLEYGSV